MGVRGAGARARQRICRRRRNGLPAGAWELPISSSRWPTVRAAADGPDVFRTFVMAMPVKERPVHSSDRVRSGQCASRASRESQDRRDPIVAGGSTSRSQGPDTKALAPVARNFLMVIFSAGRQGSRRGLSSDGSAWRLEPDSDLVVELHLMPTGKPEHGSAERRRCTSPRSAVEAAVHDSARPAGHRYPRGRARVHQHRLVRAAG